MRNEIEAGRAAMPDRDAEISQEAARAMLAALRDLLTGCEWRTITLDGITNTGWQTKRMPTDEQLTRARAAIALAERGA